MATFGDVTPGLLWQTLDGNTMRATLRNMPDKGRVTEMWAYISPGSQTQQFQMALFDDDHGKQGARKMVTGVVSVAPGPPLWVKFTPAATPDLPAGNYWLAISSGSGSAIIFGDTRTAGTVVSTVTFTSGVPSSWPTSVSYLDMRLSMYAKYTAVDEVPDVRILSPIPNEVLSGTIQVDVDASDDIGIQEVELFVDSTNVVVSNDVAAPYLLPLDTSTIRDGTHTLYVRAWDLSGNYRDTSVIVTISNRADVDVPIGEIVSIG